MSPRPELNETDFWVLCYEKKKKIGSEGEEGKKSETSLPPSHPHTHELTNYPPFM